MSIFDFLFARSTTPEQRNKNIFLDAIDGGGRFASFRDVADDDPNKFRGGPLGISALLNALGVNPYGSTDAQPQGQAFAPRPPTGPARSLRPQLRPAQQMPDELLAERFGTQFALGTPSEIETTALPPAPSYDAEITAAFDGAGFGYTAAPLNLLNAQVEALIRDSETDYLATAIQYPEFQEYVRKHSGYNFSQKELQRKARMFLNIAEGTPQ